MADEAAGRSVRQDEFVRRVGPHIPSLFRLLRRLSPTPEDAEDTLQDVLLHAYICLPGLRRPEAFGPWLRTVAYNRAMHALRRRYAEAAGRLRVWRPDDGGAGIPGAPDRIDVAEALRLRPPGDRQAVVLRYVHGWSSEEIGRLQGRVAATVRWRLREARRALRARLEGRGTGGGGGRVPRRRQGR